MDDRRADGDETTQDNLNPVGRIYYNASTMLCTPASVPQEVGLALGAQASDSKIESVVRGADLRDSEGQTQTPFNRIFEARLKKRGEEEPI